MFSIDVRSQSRDVAAAYREGVPAALLEAADQGFRVSQERVAAEATDTGQLLQSGVPPSERPDGSVAWGYNADYARDVEKGTSPHWPQIEPLKGWARRVLGDEGAAYAVQEAIAEQGTSAQPFVQPGVDAMRARLRAQGLLAHIQSNL